MPRMSSKVWDSQIGSRSKLKPVWTGQKQQANVRGNPSVQSLRQQEKIYRQITRDSGSMSPSNSNSPRAAGRYYGDRNLVRLEADQLFNETSP